jgi:hypothetical protein
MAFKDWSENVRTYWKKFLYTALVGLSQKVLGIPLYNWFPRVLWWFCFGVVFAGVIVNSIVLTVKSSLTLQPTQSNITGAICVCNTFVPNNQILLIYPNQTEFGEFTSLYASSLLLTNRWNLGQTLLTTWQAPLNWTQVIEESREEFIDKVNLIQISIQLTTALLLNASLINEANNVVALEIDAYVDSFNYEGQPENLNICPSAVCTINSYPSPWALVEAFILTIVTTELIAIILMFILSSIVWNIVNFRPQQIDDPGFRQTQEL